MREFPSASIVLKVFDAPIYRVALNIFGYKFRSRLPHRQNRRIFLPIGGIVSKFFAPCPHIFHWSYPHEVCRNMQGYYELIECKEEFFHPRRERAPKRLFVSLKGTLCVPPINNINIKTRSRFVSVSFSFFNIFILYVRGKDFVQIKICSSYPFYKLARFVSSCD